MIKKIIVLASILSLISCEENTCFKGEFEKFLGENSELILSIAHPTTTSQMVTVSGKTLEINYKDLFGEAAVLRMSFQTGGNYSEISGFFLVQDTGKVEPFLAVEAAKTVISSFLDSTKMPSSIIKKEFNNITIRELTLGILNTNWKAKRTVSICN